MFFFLGIPLLCAGAWVLSIFMFRDAISVRRRVFFKPRQAQEASGSFREAQGGSVSLREPSGRFREFSGSFREASGSFREPKGASGSLRQSQAVSGREEIEERSDGESGQ